MVNKLYVYIKFILNDKIYLWILKLWIIYCYEKF